MVWVCTNVVTEQMINNIKAEALFMRAYCMHQMVCLYGQPYSWLYDENGNLEQDASNELGIPVVLKTEFGFPARNTVKEVYTQIVKDLLDAEVAIADDYVRANVLDKAATV